MKQHPSRSKVYDGVCGNGIYQRTRTTFGMGATEPKKLRAGTFKALCENVEAGNEQGKKHGRRVILPKSCYGSVRWYQQKNYESLAIVRTRGKPHLFIAMTCNPNHPFDPKSITSWRLFC